MHSLPARVLNHLHTYGRSALTWLCQRHIDSTDCLCAAVSVPHLSPLGKGWTLCYAGEKTTGACLDVSTPSTAWSLSPAGPTRLFCSSRTLCSRGVFKNTPTLVSGREHSCRHLAR